MSQVFLIIAQISLSSSLLIAACLLLMPVLRKQFSACWRRLLWLMIDLRLLIPMALPLPADNGEAAPAALVELTVPAYLGSAERAMPEEFAIFLSGRMLQVNYPLLKSVMTQPPRHSRNRYNRQQLPIHSAAFN